VNYYRHSVDDMIPADLERALDARERAGEDEQAVDRADYTTVATPLRDLLDETLEHDVRLADDIAREQARRAGVIADADAEVLSVERDLVTLQASILGRVQRSLERISDAFNRLDLSRPEGYGARLVIHGEPPADSTGLWRWRVVPEWKRSASSKYVRYSVQANSAQVKIAAIQLVLAALLTGDQRSGRVLILDELGDSLGEVNRRESPRSDRPGRARERRHHPRHVPGRRPGSRRPDRRSDDLVQPPEREQRVQQPDPYLGLRLGARARDRADRAGAPGRPRVLMPPQAWHRIPLPTLPAGTDAWLSGPASTPLRNRRGHLNPDPPSDHGDHVCPRDLAAGWAGACGSGRAGPAGLHEVPVGSCRTGGSVRLPAVGCWPRWRAAARRCARASRPVGAGSAGVRSGRGALGR